MTWYGKDKNIGIEKRIRKNCLDISKVVSIEPEVEPAMRVREELYGNLATPTMVAS